MPVRITELSKAVWAIRQRHLSSQLEFAKYLGVTSPQVSRYERGRAIPQLPALVRLIPLAEAQCERRAIIRALRKQHVDEHIGFLRAAGLIFESSTTPTVCEGHIPEAMSGSDIHSDTPEGPAV
jgi:predicted transcriptional regulator